MKPTIRRFAFLSFFFLAFSFSLQAQSDSSSAHLSGTLADSSGAGLPGVLLAAHPESSPNNTVVVATSENDGSYSLDLPPGRYTITAWHETLGTQSREIEINYSGEPQTLNFTFTAKP